MVEATSGNTGIALSLVARLMGHRVIIFMPEHMSVERRRYILPAPFLVLATQNPLEYQGTFPLPESQLDRFLMRIELGYPEPQAERELLMQGDRRDVLKTMAPVISHDGLREMQAAVDRIKVSEPLIDYVQRLVAFSRQGHEFAYGLSPRGALAP